MKERFDCLIIDDERVLADNTCEYFNMFDVKTMAVYSQAEALSFFEEKEAALILLDINLGDGSGFELCKQIRQTLNIPILFISARNTDDDKIIALNIGGDDYVEKPYSLGVLLAKVKVILRRFATTGDAAAGAGAGAGTGSGTASAGGSSAGTAGIFDDGRLRLDFPNRTLTVNGEERKLTSLEYTLLQYLIENKDRLITKAELFDNVWKDKFTSDGTLNVHVRKIREAIEADPQNPKYIITVWKEGYKFNSGANA